MDALPTDLLNLIVYEKLGAKGETVKRYKGREGEDETIRLHCLNRKESCHHYLRFARTKVQYMEH